MKVKRHQQVYDHELASQGLMRISVSTVIQTPHGLAGVVREKVIAKTDYNDDRTPWWKRKSTRRRRKS